MLTPMKKLTVITLREFEELILRGLGDLGVLQLKEVDAPEFVGFKPAVVEDEKKEYEKLYDRFRLLRDRLEVKELPEVAEPIEIPEAELREYVEATEKRLDDILAKLKDAKERVERIEDTRSRLEVLRDNRIEVRDLGTFKDKFVKAGLISRQLAKRLEKYFSGLRYVRYKTSIVSPTDSFIQVSGTPEMEGWISDILALFNFREFVFPPSTPGRTEDALRKAEGELREAKKALAEVESKREELKGDFSQKAVALGPDIEDYMKISDAKSFTLRSETMTVLQGWVPKEQVAEVNGYIESIKDRTRGCVLVTFDDPLPDEEPPSLMKNPKVFRPFQVLTRLLGTPEHREIDPTMISTALWVVMFGMMFGDVGQGLLIAGLGGYLGFVYKRELWGLPMETIGKLWIGLGASAAFFGLLFGEFFLVETHPLLFRPLESVLRMIQIAILFGVVQITVGLVFGTINYFKEGERLEALMGEHGIAGLILLYGIVMMIVGLWVARNFIFTVQWPASALLIGLIMTVVSIGMIFARPMIAGEGAMLGFGAAFDAFLSLMANTISFARIAGFLFAHASLAIVVHELMARGLALGLTGLIGMNLIAMTIEFMVVMIQALRLLYYEFSTKFYRGQGTAYSPYKL